MLNEFLGKRTRAHRGMFLTKSHVTRDMFDMSLVNTIRVVVGLIVVNAKLIFSYAYRVVRDIELFLRRLIGFQPQRRRQIHFIHFVVELIKTFDFIVTRLKNYWRAYVYKS